MEQPRSRPETEAVSTADVPVLLEQLSTANAGARVDAALALSILDTISDEVLSALAAALRSDPHPMVRATAAWALRRGGARALPALLEALRRNKKPKRNVGVRRIAVMALGCMAVEEPAAADLLTLLLRDDDDGVRAVAAVALQGLQSGA